MLSLCLQNYRFLNNTKITEHSGDMMDFWYICVFLKSNRYIMLIDTFVA